jgi:hypothetical protein
MESHLIFFLMNDQPMTCPYCGARTDFYDLIYQGEYIEVHYCLNKEKCGFVFAAMED